jgi:hypothetical protein
MTAYNGLSLFTGGAAFSTFTTNWTNQEEAARAVRLGRAPARSWKPPEMSGDPAPLPFIPPFTTNYLNWANLTGAERKAYQDYCRQYNKDQSTRRAPTDPK